MSELAIIEIAPDMAPSIYVENGLEKFLEQIRESVKEVPDLTTDKGRKRIASLAARAADVEHRRAINAAAVQALIDQGIPDDWAKACVVAIARGKVPATTINY